MGNGGRQRTSGCEASGQPANRSQAGRLRGHEEADGTPLSWLWSERGPGTSKIGKSRFRGTLRGSRTVDSWLKEGGWSPATANE
jgi:hypothetical protein